LVVRYPALCSPDTTCDEPTTSPDFYPTLLELCGLGALPDQHTDGVSIVPLLGGEAGFERGPIFWHYPHYGNQGGTPGSSVRWGDFKLIEFFETGRLELYNLAEDVSEERDLAAERPDVTARLHQALCDWRDSVNAQTPQPNPDFVPWR
jgi:arylsulfatase A-like enzyme